MQNITRNLTKDKYQLILETDNINELNKADVAIMSALSSAGKENSDPISNEKFWEAALLLMMLGGFKVDKSAKPEEEDKDLQYADIYNMFDDIIAWLEKFHLGDDCCFVVSKSGATLQRYGGLTICNKKFRQNA